MSDRNGKRKIVPYILEDGDYIENVNDNRESSPMFPSPPVKNMKRSSFNEEDHSYKEEKLTELAIEDILSEGQPAKKNSKNYRN